MIHHIKQPAGIASGNLEDWGPVKEPVGDLIAKLRGKAGSREGEPDYGIWECSPGRWRRQIKEAEFTHIHLGNPRDRAQSLHPAQIAALRRRHPAAAHRQHAAERGQIVSGFRGPVIERRLHLRQRLLAR